MEILFRRELFVMVVPSIIISCFSIEYSVRVSFNMWPLYLISLLLSSYVKPLEHRTFSFLTLSLSLKVILARSSSLSKGFDI